MALFTLEVSAAALEEAVALVEVSAALVEASPVEEGQEEDGKMEEIKNVLGKNLISVIKYKVGPEEKNFVHRE